MTPRESSPIFLHLKPCSHKRIAQNLRSYQLKQKAWNSTQWLNNQALKQKQMTGNINLPTILGRTNSSLKGLQFQRVCLTVKKQIQLNRHWQALINKLSWHCHHWLGPQSRSLIAVKCSSISSVDSTLKTGFSFLTTPTYWITNSRSYSKILFSETKMDKHERIRKNCKFNSATPILQGFFNWKKYDQHRFPCWLFTTWLDSSKTSLDCDLSLLLLLLLKSK